MAALKDALIASFVSGLQDDETEQKIVDVKLRELDAKVDEKKIGFILQLSGLIEEMKANGTDGRTIEGVHRMLAKHTS